jgi:hypothetical protein
MRHSGWHSDGQRLRPRWKRLEAVVAVAFALSQLLGTLHFGLVRHAVCLEDGEIGHVARAEGFDASAAPKPSDPVGRVNAGTAGWSHGGTDHQHCLVQALRRESATRITARVVDIVELLKARAVELSSTRQREGSGLFRLAPKHSPPA